jgi:diguanylate cyclase (GGDEF)-like protein
VEAERQVEGTIKKAARGRVLVVDDSVVVRALLTSCLRDAGFEVKEAPDGAVGLQLLTDEGFDVVITDLHMPRLGGLDLLAEVRRRAIGTEVVILTGTHAQDVDCAIRALRLGAHDYLTKPPASPEVVIFTVEKALEKKRLRDENVRLLQDLQALSLTDALTGLPNRRSFEQALKHENARALRHGQALAVLMVDLDHFKRVNDAHGHGGGDTVLKHFAALAVQVFRDGDVIYRYGGEEFVALLPQTAASGALQAAARLIELVAGTPAVVDNTPVRVTCSVGIASTKRFDGATDMVAEADAALYEAKRSGRNRAFLPGLSLTEAPRTATAV